MTKYFCDICHNEITYEDIINVSGWYKIKNSVYCINCFQNKKNWKIIHSNLIKQNKNKTIVNNK